MDENENVDPEKMRKMLEAGKEALDLKKDLLDAIEELGKRLPTNT